MTMRGVLITSLGIALFVAACVVAISRWQFIREANAAIGIVVGLEFGGSHPKIEFSLPNRERVTYFQGGLIAGYKIGDEVQVLYREKNPKGTACIDTPGAVWAMPMILVLVSCFLLAAGRP